MTYPASACDGKRRYQSASAANMILSNMRQNPRISRRDKRLLDVYVCPFCKFWHIGKNYLKDRRA